MNKLQRVYFFEVLLYAIILITAFSVPFLSGMFAQEGWKSVWHDWSLLSLFAIVFLVNNFLLVPLFLFKEKYLYYFLSCFILVITIAWFSTYVFQFTHPGRPPFGAMHGKIEMQNDTITDFVYRQKTANDKFESKPPNDKSGPMFKYGSMPLGNKYGPRKPPRRFFNFGVAIVSFLLIGFNTGVKSFVRWSEVQVRQAEKEKQYLFTELSYLKHQISPHFLMNTLNNIHALIDINSDEAKNAVIKLSRLMRYLLYESDDQKVTLSKELEFMKSYIELMRLRYDEESLTVEIDYPESTDEIVVSSFLFLSFIENAFKHGISQNEHSFVKICFAVEDKWLSFSIRNTKSDEKSTISEASGIGMENVRKRLNLLYQDKYTLEINSEDDYHEVVLKIPI